MRFLTLTHPSSVLSRSSAQLPRLIYQQSPGHVCIFSSPTLRYISGMVLKSYTKPIDGTIPVQALLYDDEQLLGSQEGVGIYDG